jgi:hypothetical protein
LTRAQVDPFDPDSPIKQSAITTFPADMFFVLRVVQLLRGLATGASPRPRALRGHALLCGAEGRRKLPLRAPESNKLIPGPQPLLKPPAADRAGMGVSDFSCAQQWAPLARKAVADVERRQRQKWREGQPRWLQFVSSPLQLLPGF